MKASMRRSRRVRHTLKRAANGRPRLSVFRSSKHIYAQVIDDAAGQDACGGLDASTRT